MVGLVPFFLRDTVLLLIRNYGDDCWRQLQGLLLGPSCSNSFYSKGDWQVLNIHIHSGAGKIVIGQVCHLSRHMWDAIKPKFYPWLDLHKPLLCSVVHRYILSLWGSTKIWSILLALEISGFFFLLPNIQSFRSIAEVPLGKAWRKIYVQYISYYYSQVILQVQQSEIQSALLPIWHDQVLYFHPLTIILPHMLPRPFLIQINDVF